MTFGTGKKVLAIIGAGPKGIAVAVKAKVLVEFGFAIDEIILIEKQSVAAHWSGEFGYTNGEMILGTPPEKDVVFPLETDVGNDALNAQIRQRLMHFTWASFLLHAGKYSDWVDRGRVSPCHKLWAQYLQWVSSQLTSPVTILAAEVIQIDLSQNGKEWRLTLKQQSNTQHIIHADRLMLTGPGTTKMDFIKESNGSLPPSTYDLESFWSALKTNTFLTNGRIGIIGAGENAASILLALAKYAPNLQVDVISPKGFVASRAESYYENQLYSQPTRNNWTTLSLSDRLDFIERTDSGVFSKHAMTILSEQIRHKIIPGRVMNLTYDNSTVLLDVIYHQKAFTLVYDQVILATGFDPITFFKSLLTNNAYKKIVKMLDAPFNQHIVASKIKSDLSVQGIKPPLHLPMLAGLMQGPGFANLSCLGLLSDRVITHFMHKETRNKTQKLIPYLMEATNEQSASLC